MIGLVFLAVFLFVIGFVLQSAVLPASWRAAIAEHGTEALGKPIALIGFVILAVTYNLTAYDVSVGIGLGVFVAVIHLYLLLTLPESKRSATLWAVAIVGAFAGICFGWRDSEFIQQVNAAAVFGTSGWLVLAHASDRIRYDLLWLIKFVLAYPFTVLAHLPVAVKHRRALSGRMQFSSLIKTLFISTVLLFIFAGILSAADPIFAEKIRLIREQLIPRSVATLALVIAAALALYVRFPSAPQAHTPKFRFLTGFELGIPVLCIAVLFGGFLLVQAQYLFGWSHADFQTYGITYADYVREGMIHVLYATLGGGILSYLLSLKQREYAGHTSGHLLYTLNAVVTVELFLLLASALKRNWMYMETYGLTRVRITGEVFLVWLCGIVLLLALFALISRVREKLVLLGAFALCSLVVVYLNAGNMDLKIATSTPPKAQPRDALYISRLSLDAAPAWYSLVNEMHHWHRDLLKRRPRSLSTEEANRLAANDLALERLQAHVDALYDNPKRTWQEGTVGQYRAMWSIKFNEGVKAEAHFLDRAACLRREFADLAFETQVNLHAKREEVFAQNRSPFVEYWYHSFSLADGNGTAELCP